MSRLVLFSGGIDVRPEVWASIAPAVERLGFEFPALDMFLAIVQSLPMFEGRWNEYFERYFRYDAELLPSGAVRAKAAKHAIEEDVAGLMRERLWCDIARCDARRWSFAPPMACSGPETAS